MKYFLALSILMTVIVTNLACSTKKSGGENTAQQISIEDFFRNPESANYNLSPNGKYLAFLKPYKNRLNAFIKQVGTDGPGERLTNQTDRDIAGLMWKGNDHILFVRDFGGDENYHVFSVNTKTKKTRDLTPFKETRVRILDALENITKNEIMISMNKRDKKIFDVYRLNIATGKLRMIAKNPGTFTGWMTDHKGKLRVATSTDGVNTSLYYRDKESHSFRRLITTNFKDTLNPIFFTFDNKRLFAVSNLNRDKTAIVEFDPKKKKETRIVFQHSEVDVGSLSYSKKRKVLTSAAYTTWKNQRTFFDVETENIYNDLSKKLPDTEVYLTSKNRNETLYVVRTLSDRSRGAYYLYDTKTKNLEKIAELSPWLKKDNLAEMKPIKYTSRDGLTIHGYLTLPKGSNGKNVPIVVNPHGGPWARDRWRFSPEVQFLANRGYGVLQMNFRGSTGYGKKFWKASFKEWGKKMQDDVTDGVNWLKAEGIANPDKICIYGGSYGGYTTLAALTFTPNLYACGVDYVGISNLFTFMESIPPYWKPYLEMIYEMVGHPEKEKDMLRSASPLFHVEKIKAPLLVAQGAKDPRVKKAESDQIVKALKDRGIEVPYIVKENEGHGFRNEENRFEFYAAMENFFQKHLQ